MDEGWIFGQIIAELQKQTAQLKKQTVALAAEGAMIDARFAAVTLGITSVNARLDKIIKTLIPQRNHVEIKFGTPTHNRKKE
jgi:hypothetical protein